MNQLYFKMLALRPAQADDVWDADPNTSLIDGFEPILGVAAEIMLAVLFVLGIVLIIIGVPGVFAGLSNPARLKNGGLKVLGGVGAILTSLYFWGVLGEIVTEITNRT